MATHPALAGAIRDAVRARAEIATGRRLPGAHPVVLKQIGGGRRSRSSILRLVRYIARFDRLSPDDQEEEARLGATEGVEIRPGDAVAVFDVWGTPVDPSLIEEELDGWPVLTDGDNPKERVQARHLVFSAPVSRPGDTAALEIATAAALRETLAAWGHPCLWALHTDHTDRPHVHVAVGTPQGVALPLNRDGLVLDALREAFARHCRACGLDVSAERRLDRPDVGQAPRLDELDRLERRAPGWVAEWGSGFVGRVLGRSLRNADGGADAERPAAAMAAEDADLAGWYRRHRPVAFGPASAEPWADARARFAVRAAAQERKAAAWSLEGLARAVEEHVGSAELAAAVRRRATAMRDRAATAEAAQAAPAGRPVNEAGRRRRPDDRSR